MRNVSFEIYVATQWLISFYSPTSFIYIYIYICIQYIYTVYINVATMNPRLTRIHCYRIEAELYVVMTGAG